MFTKTQQQYRAEAAEFGLLPDYEAAEAAVAEAADGSGSLDELKEILAAKVTLLKLRRTIDNLKGFRMPKVER